MTKEYTDHGTTEASNLRVGVTSQKDLVCIHLHSGVHSSFALTPAEALDLAARIAAAANSFEVPAPEIIPFQLYHEPEAA